MTKFAKFHIIAYLLLASAWMSCQKENTYVSKKFPETLLVTGDARLSGIEVHLYSDTVYILATNLTINSGQKLVIDPGTLIKINDRLFVAIQPGGRIEAIGTPEKPIVFTSNNLIGSPGVISGSANNTDHFWFGIRIFGNDTALSAPSSGTMKYVRIEFSSGYDGANDWPSLLLRRVNNKTILENIEASYSYSSNSFELDGGNINARNLVSYASSSSDFFIHGGYTGKMQNLLAYRHPYFPAGSVQSSTPLAGLRIEDFGSFPLISNITIAGPDEANGTSAQYSFSSSARGALVAAKDCKFKIRNAVFFGFPKAGFYLNSRNTALSLASSESELSYCLVHANDSSRVFYLPPQVYPGITSADFRDFMLDPSLHNEIVTMASSLGFANLVNYDTYPDPSPAGNSKVLSGANFDGDFSNPFFEKVRYRGALGTGNWLEGWVNFIPLQTDYNK